MLQVSCQVHTPKVGKLDVELLTKDENFAAQYSVSISNRFQALGRLPDDVNDAWASVRDAIKTMADDVIPHH